MIEWLDEERRRDKATIATLEERLAQQQDTIDTLVKRINSVESDQTTLRSNQQAPNGHHNGDLVDQLRAEMQQLLDWWDQMKRTTDDQERLDLGKKILSYQADNLLTIGTVGEVPIPVIVNKHLHNIPEVGIYGYDTIRMQPNHPETFFLD